MGEYAYTHPIAIRLSDIDANGHVNNTAYVEYFQDARINYFHDLWGEDHAESNVVVATLEVEYVTPVELGEEAYADVRVTDVGESSWTVEYRLRAVDDAGDERVAARGSSVQVAWDREAAASRPLPTGWRRKLEGELAGTEA